MILLSNTYLCLVDLFSNTIAPAVVGASIKAFDMLSSRFTLNLITKLGFNLEFLCGYSTRLRDKLEGNTKRFRTKMEAAGFDLGVSCILRLKALKLGVASCVGFER